MNFRYFAVRNPRRKSNSSISTRVSHRLNRAIKPIVEQLEHRTLFSTYEGDTLDTDAFFYDQGNESWSYTVDYGDGSTPEDYTGWDGSGDYTGEGTFHLNHEYDDDTTASIIDHWNGYGSSGDATVWSENILNVQPTADLGFTIDDQPTTVSITVSMTNAADPSQADKNAGFHYSFATTEAGLADSYESATDGSSKTLSDTTVLVRMFDKDGGRSDYSTINVRPTINFPDNTTTSAHVYLDWVDVAGDQTAWRIRRSNDGGATYPILENSYSGSLTDYTDSTVTPGKTYWYEIRGVGTGGGDTAYSFKRSVTVPLAAADNFNASASGATQIHLTWTDTNTLADGYRIYRSLTGNGNWTLIRTTGQHDNYFDDTGLQNGTKYYYYIEAFTSGLTSETSGAESVTTLPAPTGLTASNTTANSTVLHWNFGSGHVSGFKIYRASATTYTLYSTINDPSARSASVTSVEGALKYKFEVRAFTTSANSSAAQIDPFVAMQLTGPKVGAINAPITYSVTGAASATWTITTPSGTYTGTGSQFTFTPDKSGNYTVQAVAASTTKTITLTVAAAAPKVSISGPALGFSGKSMVFSAKVANASDGTSPSYDWKLYKLAANGSWGVVHIWDASHLSGWKSDPTGTNKSTLVVSNLEVPLTAAGDNYQLRLTVTDDPSGQPTVLPVETFDFLLLPNPTTPGFEWGTVPVPDPTASTQPHVISTTGATQVATATALQDDKKIIVAGYLLRENSSQTTGWGAFVARFNPDLTIDESFGSNHSGMELINSGKLGNSSTSTTILPIPQAIAINPLNKNIIIVGRAGTDPDPFASGTAANIGLAPVPGNSTYSYPWVAELRSSPAIGSGGAVIAAGTLDTDFGNGGSRILISNPSLADDSRIPANPDPAHLTQLWGADPRTVAVADDGSIYVGGSQEILFAKINSSYNSMAVQDFLLFKLTPSGNLDTSYGALNGSDHTGFAEAAWVSRPDSATRPDLIKSNSDGTGLDEYTFQNMTSMLLQTSGKILAGGYASRDPVDVSEIHAGYGQMGMMLVRYDSNGMLDASFGSDGRTFTVGQEFARARFIQDVNTGASGATPSNPTNLVDVNGTVYFTATVGGNVTLWRSSGLNGKTEQIGNGTISSPSSLLSFGGNLYFSAVDDATSINMLWQYNVAEDAFNSLGQLLINGPLVAAGSRFYFNATTGSGYRLWASDGDNSTAPVTYDPDTSHIIPNPSALTDVNGTLFFAANSGSDSNVLWKVNTSGYGEMLEVFTSPYPTNVGQITNVNGTAYFVGTETTHGQELWKYTTSGGVQFVQDINTSGDSGSSPSKLTGVNNTLYFIANNGLGIKLWKSDATETVSITQTGLYADHIKWMKSYQNKLFFGADDGGGLWSSDGTVTGTSQIKGAISADSAPAIVGGVLYFGASDSTNGMELWRSNGTPNGTALAKNIASDTGSPHDSTPQNLTAVGNALFFTANDITHGREPWAVLATNAAELGALKERSGKIVVVGLASMTHQKLGNTFSGARSDQFPDPTNSDPEPNGPYNFVLAQYSANGVLDLDYGIAGTIVTNSTHYGPGSEWVASVSSLYDIDRDWGSYAFGSNDNVVVTLGSPLSNNGHPLSEGGWYLQSIKLSDGLPDTDFGDIGKQSVISDGPTNHQYDLRAQGPILSTANGFYGVGSAFWGNIHEVTSTDPHYFAGDRHQPLLIRYSQDETPVEGKLTATPTEDGKIRLTWTNNVSSVEGFKILRGTSAGSMSLIAAVGPDQASYTDGGAALNTGYFYQVIPFRTSIAESTATNVASATTLAAPATYGWIPASTTLDITKKYLVVVSGSTSFGTGYSADAQYWYATGNPQINGAELQGSAFGLRIDGVSPATSELLPYWGAPNLVNHRYFQTISDYAGSLSFHFNGVAGTGGLSVQLYEQGASSAVSTTPVRSIIGIGDKKVGSIPAIKKDTAISIVSTYPGNTTTQAPWGLWMTSSQGVHTLLASGSNSVGQAPFSGYEAAVIRPMLYANGKYTLELWSSSSATYSSGTLVESTPFVIDTLIKASSLTFPTTDVTLTTVDGIKLPVTRTYDSNRTNTVGLFGNGWNFNLLDSQLTTTFETDGFDTSKQTLRAGDLIYLTIPEDGQHVFEFAPAPADAKLQYGENPNSIDYHPRFIAIDGSGATLSLVSGTAGNNAFTLQYNKALDEYYWFNSSQNPIGFDPSRSEFGGKYLLTTQSGISYTIDAQNGHIESSTNTRGDVLYAFDSTSGNLKFGKSGALQDLLLITWSGTKGDSTITSIKLPGQTDSTQYTYVSGNLTQVQNRFNKTTHYFYTDSTHPHSLTEITNPLNITVLQANYDAATGELQSLVNTRGATIPVSSSGFNGSRLTRVVADAAGNLTHYLYDDHGNVERTIRQLLDSSGSVTGYQVNISKFTYGSAPQSLIASTLRSSVDVLKSISVSAPLRISNFDSAALYEPPSNEWATITKFDTSFGIAQGKVVSVSQLLNSDGGGEVRKETTYSGYKSVNPAQTYPSPPVMPTMATTIIDGHVQSWNFMGYFWNGELKYSVTGTGIFDAYNSQNQYVYGTFKYDSRFLSDDRDAGLPQLPGLFRKQFNASEVVIPDGYGGFKAGTIAAHPVGTLRPLQVDADYTWDEAYSSNPDIRKAGASYERPKYHVDADGQETYYAYNQAGQTVLQYTYKTWQDSTGAMINGWVGTTNVYDSNGRLTDVYEATYQQTDINKDPLENSYQILRTTTDVSGNVIVAVSTNGDSTHEKVYSAPRLIKHYTYNTTLGQVSDVTDEYGGHTIYTYDVDGRVIRTVNPEGTETRTVYDSLGRAIWTTRRFIPADSSDLTSMANASLATHTVYDDFGQVTATEQYRDVVIQITTQTIDSVDVSQSMLGMTGTRLSLTQKWYDEQGRVIETKDVSGLRTGTVYYPDGRVRYSGPLKDTAPDGGHSAVDSTTGVTTFTFHISGTSDFSSYTETVYDQYDSTLKLFYDHVIDPKFHDTWTYRDPLGQVVRTVYDDGSFTQTMQSVGHPVGLGESSPSDRNIVFEYSNKLEPGRPPLEDDPYPMLDAFADYAAGGQEVVSITQRPSGTSLIPIGQTNYAQTNALLAFRLYNSAGKLVDVWMPPPSTNSLVRPHFSYFYDTAGNKIGQIDPTQQVAYLDWQLDLGGGEGHARDAFKDYTGAATRWAYDQYGNQVGETLPGGQHSSATYDSFGQVLTETDFKGQTTAYLRDNDSDGQGRVTAIYYFAAGVAALDGSHNIRTTYAAQHTSYTYDSLGRQIEVSEYTGTNTTPDRDTTTTFDPVTQKVSSITSPEGTINYVYDPATGRKTHTYTNSTDTGYGYDDQGRLEHVYSFKLNGGTAYGTYTGWDTATHEPTYTSSPRITTYTYDDAGNLDTVTQPNGVKTDYDYDSQNRLDLLTVTKSGGNKLFVQDYHVQTNGLRDYVVEKRYDGTGNGDSNVTSNVQTSWTYDADDRLTKEFRDVDTTPGDGHDDFSVTLNGSDYSDTFTYDLLGNRTKKVHDEVIAANDSTVIYIYNSNNQLTSEGIDTLPTDGTPDPATATTYKYDANGSQTKVTSPSGTKLYLYDKRNRMIAADNNGDDLTFDTPTGSTSGTVNDTVDSTYGYDDDGVRVSETTGGASTYFLNDPNNPTGYTKAIEESSTQGGTPTRSYILGQKVEGQKDSTYGVLYLITDGHGSTRALADTVGGVASPDKYDYTAFGDVIGFTASSAKTKWLFGGDGVYDPASGFTYHLARWRSGFWFTSRDSYAGDSEDPLSLHKYLYANAEPVGGADPSGFFLLDLLGAAADEAGELAEGVGAIGGVQGFVNGFKATVAVYQGMQGGFINAALAPSGVNWGGAFAVGFTSAFLQESLSFAGLPCYIAGGVGGAVQEVGNNYLAKGKAAFSLEGLGDALFAGVVSGVVTGLLQGSCFVAGTQVLLGDGKTHEAIDNIHVGQRVATDGGVANSADGKTKAADPNATAVDPKTWRLVTIESDDWEVQTLLPLKWIKAHQLIKGGEIELSSVIDLAEMGVPGDFYGTIDSITACPKIQRGSGRVVLTTVTHLNNDVYTLTLTDGRGQNDAIGITGSHRVYTEDRDWVIARELHEGEVVRTANGTAIVSALLRDPGTVRVYNMTVESDHDYFVGDLTALVHNSCKTGMTGQYEIAFKNGLKYIGKGDYLRAIESAFSKVGKGGGGLKSINWTQYATDAEALIAEAIVMAKNGGIDGGKLLNKINSPGLKLLLKKLLEG